MMMALLSGMKAIKEGRQKINKRRTFTRCLAFRSCNGLVHVRRREKRYRKIVEVTDSCFKII